MNIFGDPNDNEPSSEEDNTELSEDNKDVSSDKGDQPQIQIQSEEKGAFGSYGVPEVYKSRLDHDFTVTKSLGHGSFGQIFHCKHKIDGNEYAVKRFPSVNDEKTPIEIKALSKLYHKNIVRFHQVWKERYYSTGFSSTSEDNSSNDNSVYADHLSNSEDNSSNDNLVNAEDSSKNSVCYFIQMEFCSSTVAKVWERKDEVDIERAWDLLVQLAKGIQYIHQEGYIHCDIAPSNVLLNNKGEVKICDFGLARFKNGNEDPSVSILALNPSELGNKIYRAPELELQTDKDITEKVDIYSLGVVAVDLFHLSGMEKDIKREDFVKHKKLPDCFKCEDELIKDLLLRMIHDEPDSRPPAKEVLEVLASKKKSTH